MIKYDEELPIAPNPNIKFWKDIARGLSIASWHINAIGSL